MARAVPRRLSIIISLNTILNPMKNFTPKLIALTFFVFVVHTVNAQVTCSNQNFDAVIGALPTGWSASPATNGWSSDTAVANVSSGYSNASGLQNIVIKNTSGVSGTFELTSAPISTLGFHNVSVLWGARNTTHFSDSGSTISAFQYSIDGGNTWSPLTYVQNANNSIWSQVNNGVPIALSAAADNRIAVVFKWTASLQGNASGTYRIDDFLVSGTTVTGVEQVLNDASNTWLFKANVADGQLHIESNKIPSSAIELFDMTGRSVASYSVSHQQEVIGLESMPAGIYLLAAFYGNERMVKRICISK